MRVAQVDACLPLLNCCSQWKNGTVGQWRIQDGALVRQFSFRWIHTWSDTNRVVHLHKRNQFRHTHQKCLSVPTSVSNGHLSSTHAQPLPKPMYTSLPIPIPHPRSLLTRSIQLLFFVFFSSPPCCSPSLHPPSSRLPVLFRTSPLFLLHCISCCMETE